MERGDQPITPTLIKFSENGTALPVDEYNSSRGNYSTGSIGLTKREYFAGLALQGLMANDNSCSISHIVEMSIKAADELLKQLEKK